MTDVKCPDCGMVFKSRATYGYGCPKGSDCGRYSMKLDPMPRVDLTLPPSMDYLRGLEAGRAETAAAVAAALMQAAEAVKREAWPDDDIYGPDEKQIESAERATVEVAVETILALIPAPAMAALEAVKAEARKVNIPTDIAAAVLKIGRVEWGATDPKSEA